MSVREPHETINLAELYHEDLMPWDRALQALGAGSLGPEIPCFLGTVRPDGRPHSAGVGIAEHDGYLYFTSGPQTQKSRNLIQNASCTLSLRLDGIDVIFEGDANAWSTAPRWSRPQLPFAMEAGRPWSTVTRSPPPTAPSPPHRPGTSTASVSTPRSASRCASLTEQVAGDSQALTDDRNRVSVTRGPDAATHPLEADGRCQPQMSIHHRTFFRVVWRLVLRPERLSIAERFAKTVSRWRALVLARRRAGPSCGSGPAFDSPQAFRAAPWRLLGPAVSGSYEESPAWATKQVQRRRLVGRVRPSCG
jgi:hypothetical protein